MKRRLVESCLVIALLSCACGANVSEGPAQTVEFPVIVEQSSSEILKNEPEQTEVKTEEVKSQEEISEAEPEISETESKVEENSVSKESMAGYYVDTQGTTDVYSDMYIAQKDDGTYAVEIGIYRLTTLDGVATENNGVLEYQDSELDIKGRIEINNGESAKFIVTESGWSLINAGDEFVFPEMMERDE